MKFKKRMDEIETLMMMTNKIKAYIKENKKKLLQQKSEDEKKIIQIQIANNPKLREVVLSKQKSLSISKNFSVASSQAFITENEDDDYSVPEEKDWRNEVKVLKKRTGDFNIANYIHILKPDEQIKFQKVLAKVPEPNRVYMQQ